MASFPQAFGPYVLLKSIAVGSSGEIFLARSVDVGRRDLPSPLVVKRLHADLADNEDERQRFKQEAEIAVSVDSRHVAKIYDVGRVGDSLFIAMEFIPGWTLARVMADLRAAHVPASLPSIRDIISDALEGLEALHETRSPATGARLSVVHRDVTPKNLLVGEDSVTRLIDFGSGKSSLARWRTPAGAPPGATGYWSPEQANGHPVDRRSDLYAMGVILWELLTSRSYLEPGPSAMVLRAALEPQFRPPSQFRRELGPDIDALLGRALAVDPAARFQSAREFQSALLHVLGARGAERSSNTVVGAMLWGELEASQTEITHLLELRETVVLDPSEPSEPTEPKTEIIARRSFSTDSEAMIRRERGGPNAGIKLAMVASIVASVVLLAAVVAMWMARARSHDGAGGPAGEATPPPPAVHPVAEARARPVEPSVEAASGLESAPRVEGGSDFGGGAEFGGGAGLAGHTPLEGGSELEGDTPLERGAELEGDVELDGDSEAEVAHPLKRERKKAGSKASKRSESAASTTATEVWDHDSVKRLIDRARRLARELPADSEGGRAVGRIMSDLSMEMARKQIDGERAKALAAELERVAR